MNLSKVNKNKAFTLLEILIVIAIIGLLMSIILASLSSARKKSRDVKRISDLRQIQNVLEIFYDTENQYPRVSLLTGGLPSTRLEIYDRLVNCLELNSAFAPSFQCGFTPSNYERAISQMPRDPIWGSDDNNSYTYRHYSVDSVPGKRYRLRAVLEETNNALKTDLDGNLIGAPPDGACADPALQYCVGGQ